MVNPIRSFRVPTCLALLALAFAGGCDEIGPSALSSPASVAAITLQQVLPEQTLEQPVHLAAVPDGSGDLVVVEQGGRILRFAPGAASARLFLDLRDRATPAFGEKGLLSIAFDPDYANNRFFYVDYTAADPLRTVVSRFQAPAGDAAVVAACEQVLLEVDQPYSNHNGGQLAFGPDGMLYVALGDGGGAGDPQGNGQNRNTLLGSILRIDVHHQDPGRAYAIPPDNPFAQATDGSRGEIWAYGLRNPWRFSFDRLTGALYAGDVGQYHVEEIDRIVPGGNYGWNRMEGTRCYEPAEGCSQPGLQLPIVEYGHSYGVAVVGGFVYRGRALTRLYGRYVFGDFGSGKIWSIRTDAAGLSELEPVLETRLIISSFGEDADGELYVLDFSGGRVFRLVLGG